MPEHDVTYALPSSVHSPGVARRYIRDHGAYLGPDLVADAELLVSELVSNAVQHCEPQITLSLRLSPPSIGVEVSDHGGGYPALPSRAAPGGEPPTHGRGLLIIDQIASSWGVDNRPAVPGKTVWFEIRADTDGTGREG